MRARLGPEAVGAVLSAVVLATMVGLAVATFGGTPDDPAATGPDTQSPFRASPATTVQRPTGAVLSWTSDARTVLEADEQLVDIREDMRLVLGEGAPRTSLLVQLMRDANQLLQSAITEIDASQDAGLDPELAGAIGQLHDDALAIAQGTLRASIRNDAAYRDGAERLVAALAPLEGLMQRLADASALPMPSIRVLPSQSPEP